MLDKPTKNLSHIVAFIFTANFYVCKDVFVIVVFTIQMRKLRLTDVQ